jgi:hypothetical protein
MAERRVGDEALHLHEEVEPPGLAARQDLRIVLGFEERVGGLIDRFEPAQEFYVHVALIAGHQEPHRIAVSGHQAFAVLVDRDHGVVISLLDRNAAIQELGISALGHQPFRARIDAGLVEQNRQRDARPFGVRHQPVDRLGGHLHGFAGEHRRRIAGAFHEVHARDQRIARQRLQSEFQRLAYLAVDDELVLGGIDVRHAAMIDGEVEAAGRDRAAEQMMRRAGVRIAEFAGRIAQRARHVLLEARRRLHRRHGRPEFQAPGLVMKRLRDGPGSSRRGGAHGAGDRDALPEQGAAIDQATAGDRLDRRRASSTI